VREILNVEPEDPTTKLDLCEVNEVFLEEAWKYINGTAVDDWHHGDVTHILLKLFLCEICVSKHDFLTWCIRMLCLSLLPYMTCYRV